jgi:hypothetical protein
MRPTELVLAIVAVAGGTSPLLFKSAEPTTKIVYVIDTVFIQSRPEFTAGDYDAIASRVMSRMRATSADPTVIEGDLIVKGRLGVRGAPEPKTDHAVTIHGDGSAEILFLSNEAMADPQRVGSQHRHVGNIGVAQDGGLRFGQNALCYSDARGCTVDDWKRRHAFAGFDSMGDMSFYLSDVDSLSGALTAPRSQSLVFKLIDWDKNIHIVSHRPGQRIFFNGSTTLTAEDLAWEVPLHAGPR